MIFKVKEVKMNFFPNGLDLGIILFECFILKMLAFKYKVSNPRIGGIF